jgi:hypothetical protein
MSFSRRQSPFKIAGRQKKKSTQQFDATFFRRRLVHRSIFMIVSGKKRKTTRNKERNPT